MKQENPFNTESVLWLDPLSHCNALGLEKDQSVNVFAPGQMGMFLDRMSRVMITVSKYSLTKEVHGFAGTGFSEYSGLPKGGEFDLVTGVTCCGVAAPRVCIHRTLNIVGVLFGQAQCLEEAMHT
jgi:hypothetical protein